MSLPNELLDHLRKEGYHPRSNKHSDALSRAILIDLMQNCVKIAADATAGRVVFKMNHDILFGRATWNTDLAIGPPGPGGIPKNAKRIAGMAEAVPVAVRIAVEHKAIMTEHHKAYLNRQRDLEAHHQHVHDNDERAIAAGIFIINSSPTFRSPLRSEGVMTEHADPVSLVTMCINALQDVTMSRREGDAGLDAKCALVVNLDNIHFDAAVYMEKPPAPQLGEPLHWDSFIARLCDLYTRRF
jgi:hypothetical protein